jgi:hypothetical protein
LERGDQAPVLRTTLLHAENVQHLGSAAERDGLFLLAHGERGEENRDKAILAPGHAILRMTR